MGRCWLRGIPTRVQGASSGWGLALAHERARIAGRTPEAQRKRGNTQRQHRQSQSEWSQATQPEWLSEAFYAKEIQPKLPALSSSFIASRLGVSRCYAGRIRHGYRPHPRHWHALADLVEVMCVVNL